MQSGTHHLTMVPYVAPLSSGGYLVEYPDLPGCMADGETIEESLREGEDAVQAWIAIAEGANIPEPNKFRKYSWQFRARLPISLHAELARRAEMEGVSLNTLATGLSKQYFSDQEHKKVND